MMVGKKLFNDHLDGQKMKNKLSYHSFFETTPENLSPFDNTHVYINIYKRNKYPRRQTTILIFTHKYNILLFIFFA